MKQMYVRNPRTKEFEPFPMYSVQPYNDAPLQNKVTALESGKLDKSVYDADKPTFATKTEVNAIDAKIGNINNMLDNINGEQI